MFNIKPSNKVLFTLIGAGVLMLLVCGFVYYSTSSKLANLQASVQEKQVALEDSRETIKLLEEVEREYLDSQAQLSVLEKGVSTKAYVPTLLRQLEELGKDVNLRVVGVRPSPPMVQTASEESKEEKQEEPYDRLDFEIVVHGKYWDVVRFLKEITSFPKIVAVRDVYMSPVMADGRNPKSPVLSVRLTNTAFILKQDATDQKAASQGTRT